MRAFRAAARIGTPRSLASQKKLARDDKPNCTTTTPPGRNAGGDWNAWIALKGEVEFVK
jgi:hypothetical protein